uniref:uncharacterized protein LOC122580068 n=1 Tax=Erigeron canadensis TaxID=72917 RepID=UPI001CB9B209|nr:uncharacterized protein LOC122580068 [Erigeron canadensis]
MQTQMKIEESEISPSFNCYSSDSLTSKAVDKVIREEHARLNEFGSGVVEGNDFEFSVVFSDEEEVWASFPVFNRDILLNDEINNNISKDGSAFITTSLGNLFIDNDQEESSSSSSEVDELENIPSGTFCIWKPKTTKDGGSSPGMSKCKKSNSTGSTVSKKWKIRCSFKRCNSEGKEPMVSLLTPPPNSNNKKIDSRTSPKRKRIISGKLKTQTPVHELFYVQRRAENEMGKKKSYLPYRKDMFGLFANVNGMGKMLPF